MPKTSVFLAPCHDEFRGLRSDCVRQEVLGLVHPRGVIYTKNRLGTPWRNQSSRRSPHRINARIQPTALSAAIQALVASLQESFLYSQTIQRHLAEGNLGSRHPLRVLPLMVTHRSLRLEWSRARGNRTEVDWNQVVFRDECRFNFRSDDNPVCVWRPRGEHLPQLV
ncbi:transposable element Tcb2 transposase [Trichonephila clavipes]|nr:transposable element Tcb2 transposase [Trichonephila clavipes]